MQQSKMDTNEDNDTNKTPLSESTKDLVERKLFSVKDEPETDEKETMEMKMNPDIDSMETDENEEDIVEAPTSSRSFYLSLWIYMFR